MSSAEWKSFFRVQRAHVGADTLVFIAMIITFILLYFMGEPVVREFNPADPELSYKMTEETVSNTVLMMVSLVIPLVLILVTSLIQKNRADFDTYFALSAFIINFLTTAVFTETIKNTTGAFRPDFLDRCQWDATTEMCTGDPHDISEGRRSFFSGHSSLSFSGLGFLAFYFAGRIHLFDGKGPFWKTFVFLTPLVGAAVISVTRVTDYRHHWRDVVAGSLVGLSIALFVYRVNYPSLFSKDCGIPKLHPTAKAGSGNLDEEALPANEPEKE